MKLLKLLKQGFANSASGMANAMVAPVFQVSQRDGLFIPYGEFEHKKGLQLFDRTSAEFIVQAFNEPPSWIRRVYRWVANEPMGVPIYIGHPDVPELRDRYPDKKAYGWVTGMQALENGLQVHVKWNDAGRDLIENAHYRFYSPYWIAKQIKDGVHSPRFLRSIGLTNEPNIPVPAIANEADDAIPIDDADQPKNQNNSTMKSEWKKLLGIAEDADEDVFEEALKAVLAKLTNTENELKQIKEKKPDEPPPEADPEKLKREIQEQKTAMENTLQEMRSLRINAALDHLTLTGKLLPANRATEFDRLVKLANEKPGDLDGELVKLANEAPKLKTQSTVTDAAGGKGKVMQTAFDNARKAEFDTAMANELDLVRKERGDHFDNWTVAFNRVRHKRPELFKPAGKA